MNSREAKSCRHQDESQLFTHLTVPNADLYRSLLRTLEDFHRKRSLYQLTATGQAAEQAIAFYEEAIGRRGQLQSVALADISDRLRSLLLLASDGDPDPAKVLPWNSGKVEGTVTKIKMIKRQTYGRASFPLLRKRVLLA